MTAGDDGRDGHMRRTMMNRYKLAVIAAVLCVTVISLSGRGQQSSSPPPGAGPAGAPGGNPRDSGYSVMVPPPLTRLEALAAQKGLVIVKGYTDIGTLVADDQSSVLVSAVQFSDGTNKEHGVALHVSQTVEGRSVQTTAYVDEEEIDGLVAAIDSISKLQDGAASPMQHFDARYQTLGALELVGTNVNGGRMVMVRALELRPGMEPPVVAQAPFFVSRMPELGQKLTAAKELLGKVKAGQQATQP
jgi:hypothetical protein